MSVSSSTLIRTEWRVTNLFWKTIKSRTTTDTGKESFFHFFFLASVSGTGESYNGEEHANLLLCPAVGVQFRSFQLSVIFLRLRFSGVLVGDIFRSWGTLLEVSSSFVETSSALLEALFAQVAGTWWICPLHNPLVQQQATVTQNPPHYSKMILCLQLTQSVLSLTDMWSPSSRSPWIRLNQTRT